MSHQPTLLRLGSTSATRVVAPEAIRLRERIAMIAIAIAIVTTMMFLALAIHARRIEAQTTSLDTSSLLAAPTITHATLLR